MAEHSDFNIEIKKDIKFLHVVDDLEKYMTETAIRLDMEDEFVDAIVDYPALNVIGAIDDRDVYYPSKLRNPRTIELIGDVTGSADFDGSQNIQIDTEILNNSHTHIIENVDGLQDSLDYKSNVDHVHDYVPITTSITAGSGLIGGGALNSSRTIAMQTPKTCTLHTLNEFPSGGGHTHAITGVVPLTRTITAGVGLTGGGILSTDLTLTLGTPTTCTASTTNSVTATSHTHEITGFAETSFSIIAGNGLTGGGSLSSSRTITLGTPSSCSPSTTNEATSTSHTHTITGVAAESHTHITYVFVTGGQTSSWRDYYGEGTPTWRDLPANNSITTTEVASGKPAILTFSVNWHSAEDYSGTSFRVLANTTPSISGASAIWTKNVGGGDHINMSYTEQFQWIPSSSGTWYLYLQWLLGSGGDMDCKWGTYIRSHSLSLFHMKQ